MQKNIKSRVILKHDKEVNWNQAENSFRPLNGEIISGDSMQIYRGMDIGTAKATLEERQGIVHHLIDEKNPDEPYSVAAFQQTVRAKIEEIKSRGKLPIIVGGTGLYIKSVLYDYEFAGESESKEVDEMKYGHLSNEELHAKLAEIDEAGAKAIHPNNRKRVIRALEIYETSGIKKSEMIEKQEHKLIYDVCLIGLTDDRKVLYDRINKRVDKMYETGLVEEVEVLFKQGIPSDAQSIRAIGYKELYDYFTTKVREKGVKVGEGIFQAEMLVRINNDGPVTILLDSKKC